jgi:ABC-type uncharacterized transport system permease subunit
LVNEPNCRTEDGVITEWTDVRPQPTDAEIDAVNIIDVEAAELEVKAFEFADAKKAFAALLEILYENPDLTTAFASIQDLKLAAKDRYKSKL